MNEVPKRHDARKRPVAPKRTKAPLQIPTSEIPRTEDPSTIALTPCPRRLVPAPELTAHTEMVSEISKLTSKSVLYVCIALVGRLFHFLLPQLLRLCSSFFSASSLSLAWYESRFGPSSTALSSSTNVFRYSVILNIHCACGLRLFGLVTFWKMARRKICRPRTDGTNS